MHTRGRWTAAVAALALLLVALMTWLVRPTSSEPSNSVEAVDGSDEQILRVALVRRGAPELLDAQRRPADREAESTAPEAEPPATFLLRDQMTSAAPPVMTWSLASASNLTWVLKLTSAPDGSLVAPQGEWRMECADPAWRVLAPRIRATPGLPNEVWVARECERSVVVRDSDAQPVAGALVRWLPTLSTLDPTLEDEPWSDAITPQQARTNSAGRAHLAGLVGGVGKVAVLAEGFRVAYVQACGADAEELQVTLWTLTRDCVRVQLVDADSGAQLSHVGVRDSLSVLDARSDEYGALELPGWVSGDETLLFEGAESSPATALASALNADRPMRLPPVCELHVSVVDEAGRRVPDATLLPALVSPPPWELDVEPHVPSAVATDQRGECTVRVPRGAVVRVDALGQFGESAAGVSVETKTLSESVQIVVRDEQALELTLRDPESATLPKAHAWVQYSDFARTLVRATSDGRLRVPHVERVQSIAIEAPGYAPVRLQPHPTSTVVRTGSLPLTLSPACSVTVRVVDSAGAPVQGVSIALSDERHVDAYFRDRSLFGAWPTAHPAWIESSPLDMRGTTGSHGTRRFDGLLAGSYRASARPPEILLPDGGVGDVLNTPLEHVFAVPQESTVELVFPRLRRVIVEGFEIESGRPVAELEVRRADGVPSSPARAVGNRWEGWVAEDCAALLVASEVFAVCEVAIPRTSDPLVRVRADLGLARSMHLQLASDDAAALATAGARFRVLQPVPLTWAGGEEFLPLAFRSLTVPPSGSVNLALPYEPGVVLQFEPFESGTQRFTFDPPRMEWSPGSHRQLALVALDLPVKH